MVVVPGPASSTLRRNYFERSGQQGLAGRSRYPRAPLHRQWEDSLGGH